MENNWNDIMTLINENQIDRIVELFNQMEECEYKNCKDKLIKEIRYTKEKKHRNTIAIVLGDLKCNEAITTIVDLINMPQNRNCIGTLIYALQELDCEKEIKKIVHVLFDGNLESKCNMYHLLLDKIHSMSKEDRLECLDMIEKEKCKLEEELDFIEDVRQDIFMANSEDGIR